jgi:hypothetical protein
MSGDDRPTLDERISFVRSVFDGLADHWVKSRPLPRTVPRARRFLDGLLAEAVSQLRQSEEDDPREWNEDNTIGAGEAATLLGCDRKTVQRNADRLGGRLIAGRWVFDRTQLEDMEDVGA